MTESEKQTFLGLCDFLNKNDNLEILLQTGATYTVLGLLFYNRMQGIAYKTLADNHLLGNVNREFRNSLEGGWENNIQKNNSFFNALTFLSDVLSKSDCCYAFLKGSILCGQYPIGCRTSNDVDLLVHPHEITNIGTCLLNAGFKQGKIENGEFHPSSRKSIIESRITKGETVPYILDIGLPMMKYLEVDINFSPDYKNSDPSIILKMLERTQQKKILNTSIKTLCSEDFFIHLCCHLYKEATTMPWIIFKRDMTLYKYSDIYLLLNGMSNQVIDRIFNRAAELGMTDACLFSILQTADIFPLTNQYAVFKAKKVINNDETILNTVFFPQEKKVLQYITTSTLERFFTQDRTKILQEV